MEFKLVLLSLFLWKQEGFLFIKFIYFISNQAKYLQVEASTVNRTIYFYIVQVGQCRRIVYKVLPNRAHCSRHVHQGACCQKGKGDGQGLVRLECRWAVGLTSIEYGLLAIGGCSLSTFPPHRSLSTENKASHPLATT